MTSSTSKINLKNSLSWQSQGADVDSDPLSTTKAKAMMMEVQRLRASQGFASFKSETNIRMDVSHDAHRALAYFEGGALVAIEKPDLLNPNKKEVVPLADYSLHMDVDTLLYFGDRMMKTLQKEGYSMSMNANAFISMVKNHEGGHAVVASQLQTTEFGDTVEDQYIKSAPLIKDFSRLAIQNIDTLNPADKNTLKQSTEALKILDKSQAALIGVDRIISENIADLIGVYLTLKEGYTFPIMDVIKMREVMASESERSGPDDSYDVHQTLPALKRLEQQYSVEELKAMSPLQFYPIAQEIAQSSAQWTVDQELNKVSDNKISRYRDQICFLLNKSTENQMDISNVMVNFLKENTKGYPASGEFTKAVEIRTAIASLYVQGTITKEQWETFVTKSLNKESDQVEQGIAALSIHKHASELKKPTTEQLMRLDEVGTELIGHLNDKGLGFTKLKMEEPNRPHQGKMGENTNVLDTPEIASLSKVVQELSFTDSMVKPESKKHGL